MPENQKFDFNTISTRFKEQVPWKISDVLFTYFLIFVIAIIYTGFLLYASIDMDMTLFSAVMQIALSFTTITIIYLIVTKKYKLSFKQAFGISFHKMKCFFQQGMIATVAIVISTTLVSLFFTNITNSEAQNPYMDLSEERIKILILLAVFIAPVVEEVFFRGFMQPAMIKKFGAISGIFITALFFGFSHTQYLDYGLALFAVTTIGLILGITKYYTGSIMPGVFAHLFNNMLAVMNLLG